MKAFVVVSCLLAVASAGYLGPVDYSGHAGVLGHDGHPVDTAEVAHAKAAHFAAVAEANARIASVAPQGHAHAAPVSYASHYNGPQHIPVIGPLGVPLETPEVVAAKAANAAAHAKANGAANGYGYAAPAAHGNYGYAPVAQASYGYAAAPVAHGVLGHDGHPVDTAEVAHAKAAHFAAVAEATARASPVHRYRRGLINAYASPLVHSYASPLVHAYPQHLPVIGANGVPLDTPEVAAGKIANAVAHAEAKARNGAHAIVSPLAYSGLAAHSVLAAPLAVAHSYAGIQHLPVIGANGVPLDTPEVAAGKVANAVAHAEAKARNGDLAVVAPVASLAYSGLSHGVIATPLAHTYATQHIPVIGAHGVPLDTPEVAAGKIANAVAHAEAKARNLVHHY